MKAGIVHWLPTSRQIQLFENDGERIMFSVLLEWSAGSPGVCCAVTVVSSG